MPCAKSSNDESVYIVGESIQCGPLVSQGYRDESDLYAGVIRPRRKRRPRCRTIEYAWAPFDHVAKWPTVR